MLLGRLFAGAIVLATAMPARAESATDVSPVCTTVRTETSKDSLLSRTSYCQKTEPLVYVATDGQNNEIGRVAIEAYAYSDNPSNQLAWPVTFRFRTRVLSGNPPGLVIKPIVECGADCTVAPNAGVPLALGGLSNELSVMITPNMGSGNPLRVSPTLEYRVAKSGDSFENGASMNPYAGVGYIPNIRCDVALVKSNSQGCIYADAPAILRTIVDTNPDVNESAIHIREAQAAGRPGKFVPKGDGTIFPAFEARPLTRTRDAAWRRANRSDSKAQCIEKFGPVTGQCTFTGDPDETPSDCDCDEYPFASTEQGASREPEVSVKRIDASDNRRAGAFLGSFYLNQRVIDQEAFFVDVGSSQPAAKR
ncbi:hypothetical protein G3N96_15020 [Burkholderia sp. Se-20373]|nr:hypothetical protein [Burkholderia sp. Se-20373]